jgi:hypothetical protein
MPKIINAYASNYAQPSPFAKALQGFASSFGANTPQTEAARQKAYGLSRENTNIPLLADAVVGDDPAATARYGIMSGVDPKATGGYRQYFTTQKYGPASEQATRGYMSVPGANYGNTARGTRETLANRFAIGKYSSDRGFDAARYRVDNTPETIFGPKGTPTLAPRSKAFGQQPVLTKPQAQGAILQQDTPSLTPAQRATAGGYAPKNPGNIWVGRAADGSLHSTADGRTALDTGEPIVGPVQKIEGPDAGGLGRNKQALNKLIESRTSVRTAVAQIDQLTTDLSKPNAGAAVGFLGSGAEVFNNARAQVESAIALVGGETAEQAFASPENQQAVGRAINFLFNDPQFNAQAQRLGIDAIMFRSQFQDLAYAIAKAREPGGRLGVDDIKRAATTIGAASGDPQAMAAVLGNVKNALVRGQQIRESVLREMYPDLQGSPAQPAAPAGAAAPAADGVVDFKTYFGGQ